MSTIVGTNIEVTNIKYDSDTTSMIISNAGQVTIQGEGTNTTNLQQGLVKGWSHFQGGGTAANVDGLNISSIDDDGTGDYGLHYTNNMANVTYLVVNGMDDDGVSTAGVLTDTTNGTMATGSVDFETFYLMTGDNRTNYDYYNAYLAIIGDLA